mmetsp:Transcript_40792/g.93945  ORF Transcript_40792/g.93945 Transcript_40792/m.93945 type:complete len:132 (+) Transcript_40792:189-584(+)
MAPGKKPKYESVQYVPPTPQVFGNVDVELPKVNPSSYDVDRPRNRPKLQDRLAVYEDDDPGCMRWLCYLGLCCFPLWWIGAFMYFKTPASKVLTRDVGFRNVVMSVISCIVLIMVLIVVAIYIKTGSGGAH